jgi:hypothetical protein
MTPSREAPASKRPRPDPVNSTLKGFRCRRCNEKFENKRDLYLHGMRQHYQTGGVQLQPSPYGQGPYPWEIEGGETDLALKEVYTSHSFSKIIGKDQYIPFTTNHCPTMSN